MIIITKTTVCFSFRAFKASKVRTWRLRLTPGWNIIKKRFNFSQKTLMFPFGEQTTYYVI